MLRRQTTRSLGMEAARRNDEALPDAALAAFVDDHYERLLGLARLVCRDTTEAADAVQAGLEQAWRHRSTLRDDSRLRPWLDRIVVREALRARRARGRWLLRFPTHEPSVAWIEPIDRVGDDLPAWLSFRAAFERLSPEQRAVVALHLHRGYTVAETADILGAPVETVRSRLRLARQRLRRELEEAD